MKSFFLPAFNRFRASTILGLIFGILLAGYAVFWIFNQNGDFPAEVQAGSTDNVSGYAWSENIGWISFNCTDAGTCGSVDYGVNIKQDGYVEGYAWSENIGWFSFNLADTGNPPGQYDYTSQSSILWYDQGNGQIRGWSRALAGMDDSGDGWDGWIKLRDHPSDGGADYDVTIDEDTGEFHGWAWGGDVVGWISFNCEEGGSSGENVCATSDYKVAVDLAFFSSPPTAAFSCNPANCIGFTGGGLQLINESTDPDGASDIKESQWTGIIPELTCSKPSPLCNYTTQPVAANTYTVQLRVEDKKGNVDTTQAQITIKQDIVANFDCSLNGISWQDCNTLGAVAGELVYFRDLSTPSQGASVNSWSWSFQGGSPSSSASQNPTTTFQTTGTKTVSLQAQDTAGRTDTKQVSFGVSISFPEWQEISPF